MFHICSCLTIFASHLYVTYLNILQSALQVPDNLFQQPQSTGSEVSKGTAINYFKTPFIVLLFLLLQFETEKKILKFFCALLVCTSLRVQYSKVRDLSITPVKQLKRQLNVRFFYTWYYTWSGLGILARKSSLVMK